MKILRILLASPFILIGAIPAFIAAVSFLVAYRIMTIGKVREDAGKGLDITSLMNMMGGNKEDDKHRPE